MRELSLHILDIIENALDAGATLITLLVERDQKNNWLKISIGDNGRGIPEKILKKVLDPFYTTRVTRRVGFGLSLFREATKRCDGEFSITSTEGKGTQVDASFRLDHIDLTPMGDLASSLTTLIMGNSDVDFVYTYRVDGEEFHLDTRQVKEALDGLPINHPKVIKYLAGVIRESLTDIATEKVTLDSGKEDRR